MRGDDAPPLATLVSRKWVDLRVLRKTVENTEQRHFIAKPRSIPAINDAISVTPVAQQKHLVRALVRPIMNGTLGRCQFKSGYDVVGRRDNFGSRGRLTKLESEEGSLTCFFV